MDDITKKALIRDFITRCFRDTADRDYISARLCHRYSLDEQFYWSALQAIEKYLKAILLYNGKSTKKLSHNITNAYKEVLNIKDITFKFPQDIEKYLEHIEVQGKNRYFEYSRLVYGQELLQLDQAVWHIRQYCFYLREVPSNNTWVDLLQRNIKKIEDNIKKGPSKKSFAFWGILEDVLSNKKSDLRKHLVWKNFYFGSYRKKAIRYSPRFSERRPTLVLHPEIYPELEKMVKFSPEVQDYFRKKTGP